MLACWEGADRLDGIQLAKLTKGVRVQRMIGTGHFTSFLPLSIRSLGGVFGQKEKRVTTNKTPLIN